LLGWAALRGCGESSLRWKRAGLAVGLAILCCLPWTIRNYVAFHRLVPVRSNLPFELWLGNNDIFDEDARGGRQVITRTEEARRYAQLGETGYMAEKWELATSFMRTHPEFELRLAGRKFVDFWMGTEAPVKNFRETDSWLIRGVLLSSFLTAVGALLGVVVLGMGRKKITPRATRGERRRRVRRAGAEPEKRKEGPEQTENLPAFPLAVFPVVFPWLYYLTHADLRYRHPIDPVIVLLTVIGVWGVVQGQSPVWIERGKSQ
jgi:hypothetical protein